MAVGYLARFEDLDLLDFGAANRGHEVSDVRERSLRLVVLLFFAVCADDGIGELVESLDVVLGFESCLLVDSTQERVVGTPHSIVSIPLPDQLRFGCAAPPPVERAEAAKRNARRLPHPIGISGGVSAATVC